MKSNNTNSPAASSSTDLVAQAVMHTIFVADDNTIKTNSRFVAEVFGKNHKDVLRAIDSLECSKEFNGRNFAPVKYIDAKGESRPMYEITFDGFTFLVMGFTGAKAAAFKEAYIAEFNRMRLALAERLRDEALEEARAKAVFFEKYARLPILPLTPETEARVLELITQRMPIADIARVCRVSQGTVRMLRDKAQAKTASADLFTQGE